MWEGKSMIPLPKFTTLRRVSRASGVTSRSTPTTKTPSRIARPLSKYPDGISCSSPATPTSENSRHRSRRSPHHINRQDNSNVKRGDLLAEQVIASDIISPHPTQSNTRDYNEQHAFERPTKFRASRLPVGGPLAYEYHEGNGSENFGAAPILTLPETIPKTPPMKFKSALISRTEVPTSTFDLTTPESKPVHIASVEVNSNDELAIDEELVTRTPAKHKNREWLTCFGIDVSLLKVTEDDVGEENHDPNVTPSPDVNRLEWSGKGSNSKPKPTSYGAFQRRRATDLYSYARSTGEGLAGPPNRVASASKTRRASARISVRELDALKSNKSLQLETRKVEEGGVPKGSEVFLTPVRATRRQRERNGTPVVLSEVRRSLRINTPSSKLVPKNSVRGRIELLEANDHSYIPNPTLT